MSRNLTQEFLAETAREIARALSISDVTRIAYRMAHSRKSTELAEALHRVRAEHYTAADIAWFKRPLGGAL